jgi:hypothetical protein
MAKITTLDGLKDYLLYRCGYPVVNVEVDRDTQLDNIISDTIQMYQNYNLSDGTQEYFIFSAIAGVDTYNMSGLNIQGIVDIDLSMGMDSINIMFSPTHQILYSDFIRKGSIMGVDNPDFSPGLTLTSFDVAMMYLKEIKNHFGRGYAVQYNKNRETLKITPVPSESGVGVLTLYKKEEAIYLYNEYLIKELAYGKTMMQWAQNLGKNSVTMPDGISVNYQDIYSRGKEIADAAMADIKSQSPPPDFCMG